MGASLSTLGGWTVIVCIAGYYAFRHYDGNRRRELARSVAQQKKRVEDRLPPVAQKENKKTKRQRGESIAKDGDKADKSTKAKQRPTSQQPLAATTNQQKKADYSSDDGADNREFAKQLAIIKQGTSFIGSKKGEEKKAKSVKQSRAQEPEAAPKAPTKVSAPSSTTGADADDDQSPAASPEFTPADSRDVTDMLERPSGTGPSVLRLTETEKAAKPNNNKTKAPEVKETKKQRQNRAKAEAAKLAREAEEAERKVKLEQQRRTARIAEGRAAKDGSLFTNAAAPKSSAWSSQAANGSYGSSSPPSSQVLPVQPLDTGNHTDDTPASGPSPVEKSSDNWVSSLPSEEEQLSLLKDEENWNTVTSKKAKARRKTKENVTSDSDHVSNDAASVASNVREPQKIVPDIQKPVVTASQTSQSQSTIKANGRPSTFGKQSSFAALNNDDDEEQEQEWDV